VRRPSRFTGSLRGLPQGLSFRCVSASDPNLSWKEPMKLKLTILSALLAAGVFASFALAAGGTHAAKKSDTNCHEVHISGTIAPQTLAVTVDKASKKALIPAGTQLSLAVGAAGQTVRLKAEACATGTGTALVLTVKQVELKPAKVKTTSTP
jgi:hypothetical protein